MTNLYTQISRKKKKTYLHFIRDIIISIREKQMQSAITLYFISDIIFTKEKKYKQP